VYGNLADGIQLSNTIQSCTVYNNTAYGNSGRGIWVAGTGSASEMLNNTVKNNMSEGNGGNQLQAIYGGENDGTMGSGNVYTYNDFGAQATNFIVWGAIKYKSTYSAWETVYCGTTGCSHSVQSNPFFVSTSIPNFQLEAGSPAIYAGVNVGLTTDYARNSVHNPPSIGAYEYGEETVPGPPGNLRLGGQ
jgi:parallel beta-helix repeat protein